MLHTFKQSMLQKVQKINKLFYHTDNSITFKNCLTLLAIISFPNTLSNYQIKTLTISSSHRENEIHCILIIKKDSSSASSFFHRKGFESYLIRTPSRTPLNLKLQGHSQQWARALCAWLRLAHNKFEGEQTTQMPRLNNPTTLLKETRPYAKAVPVMGSEEVGGQFKLPMGIESVLPFSLPRFQSGIELRECVQLQLAKIVEWRPEEDQRLYALHNQLGNKWSLISNHFQKKNDNSIKNHFFSRLRMSIRHLNRHISNQSLCKPAKMHVIYKIMSTCQERFNSNSEYLESFISFACQLKNDILSFLDRKKGEDQTVQRDADRILEKIHIFNKRYKMRADILKIPKQRSAKIVTESIQEDYIQQEEEENQVPKRQNGFTTSLVSLETVLEEGIIQMLDSSPSQFEIKFIDNEDYLFDNQEEHHFDQTFPRDFSFWAEEGFP